MKVYDYNIPVDLIGKNGKIILEGIKLQAPCQKIALKEAKKILKKYEKDYTIHIDEENIFCDQEEEIMNEIERDFGLQTKIINHRDGSCDIVTTQKVGIDTSMPIHISDDLFIDKNGNVDMTNLVPLTNAIKTLVPDLHVGYNPDDIVLYINQKLFSEISKFSIDDLNKTITVQALTCFDLSRLDKVMTSAQALPIQFIAVNQSGYVVIKTLKKCKYLNRRLDVNCDRASYMSYTLSFEEASDYEQYIFASLYKHYCLNQENDLKNRSDK